MTQTENLLVTVAEECAEIQQAVSKALRFGLDNHHPNCPNTTNAEEINMEFYQLCAVINLLQVRGSLPTFNEAQKSTIMSTKLEKVTEWQTVSVNCKTLDC